MAGDMDTQAPIDELQDRLRRYPADRYPVQHATAQFHLGSALIGAGEPEAAMQALRTSAELFGERLPVEQAKAKNMVGAALLLLGRLGEAAEAFAQAASVFQEHELALEEGAARFNLGLVRRDVGDTDAALESFRRAGELFEAQKVAGQSSAAARELGATLLAMGNLEAATDALERATEWAYRIGDNTALGAATNALGLAHLASGRVAEAIEALRTAAVASPRSIRPEGYAMAKANLALAYAEAGDSPRARLAARQALGTSAAPAPVVEQAAGVLERLGESVGDLFLVLDGEDQDRWLALVREEMARWADASPLERRREAAAWVQGQLERPAASTELAEAWVGALLELPPGEMESLIQAAVAALFDFDLEERERFRSDVSRAMVRFNPPQWLRLKDTFNRIATEMGEEPQWG